MSFRGFTLILTVQRQVGTQKLSLLKVTRLSVAQHFLFVYVLSDLQGFTVTETQEVASVEAFL